MLQVKLVANRPGTLSSLRRLAAVGNPAPDVSRNGYTIAIISLPSPEEVGELRDGTWRTRLSKRLDRVEADLNALAHETRIDDDRINRARTYLADARAAIDRRARTLPVRGDPAEPALVNYRAAVTLILRHARTNDLLDSLPATGALVDAVMPSNDQRRTRIDDVLRRSTHRDFEFAEGDRTAVVDAIDAALLQEHRRMEAFSRFRAVVWTVVVLTALLALALAIGAALAPTLVPLCLLSGDTVVCPLNMARISGGSIQSAIDMAATSRDYAVVESLGILAGAVFAGYSLMNLRNVGAPYSLTIALVALKPAVGALTVLLGLMLLRGRFFPASVQSSTQLLAWAVVFGFAQQLSLAHSIFKAA